MTEPCMKSFSPDGLTGMIFAAEGMRDTIVLLNGPMGCRFYHSSTSGFLMQRPVLYVPTDDGTATTTSTARRIRCGRRSSTSATISPFPSL